MFVTRKEVRLLTPATQVGSHKITFIAISGIELQGSFAPTSSYKPQ
jgi:hypothetical protein